MTPRDRAAAILVVVTVAFAALALGGTPRWAAAVAAALGILSAVPYIGSRREVTGPGPLLIFLLAAAAFTAFQAIPLPWFLVELLSPAKGELLAGNAAALGKDTPAFASLSYDPAATLLEVARLIGYIGLAYAASRVACSKRGRVLLAMGLAGVGVVVVAITFAHAAVGATRLYGIYKPQFVVGTNLAPFLNPNHLAGFLALLAPISVGLAVRASGPWRLLFIGASVATAAGSLLATSRAGAAALVIGLAAAGGLLWLQRNQATKRRWRRSNVIGVAIVLGCAVVLVGALAGGQAWEQITRTRSGELTGNEGKLAAWRAALPLARDHWLTGVGRGGFEPAFTKVHGHPGEVFSHVENEYLQAVVDWGVPGAALLAVLMVLAVRRAASRWAAGPIEAGCLGGLVAIALHNMLDFNLAFAGVAAPAIVMLALLVRPSLARATWPQLRAARVSATVIALCSIALVATPLGRTARQDAAQAEGDGALDTALHAWVRHPSDYRAAGYTARALLRQGDARAAAVIARALSLHPRHPDLHLLAARLLLAANQPSQAAVEYRLALRYAWRRHSIDRLVAEIVEQFADPAQAIRALPEDPEQVRRLVQSLEQLGRPDLALGYAQRVTEYFPDHPVAWQEVSRLAEGQGQGELALRAAERALRGQPSAAAAIAFANLLIDRDRPEDAMRVLERAMQENYSGSAATADVEVLRTLARAQLAQGAPDQARDTLMRALGLAGTHRGRLAGVHTQLAALEQAQGNDHRARWHREQASEINSR